MATLASHDTHSPTAVSVHAAIDALSSSIWGPEECCGIMDFFSYGAEGGLSKAMVPSFSVATLSWS